SDIFNEIHYDERGNGPAVIVWAHGWGQNLHALDALASPFERQGHHILIDFPGFGNSPPPPRAWGTADYADAVAALIRSKTQEPVLWIGHSFGCRVGIQMAARHPDLVRGMVLIAGAGLPRKRPMHRKLSMKARVALFKFLKKLIPLGLNEEWLKTKFGSRDYRTASPAMRALFVKVVNEDLSAQAAQIRCPVLLIYGQNDTETPPEIGKRLNALIPGAELIVLPEQDHYSVLNEGRHQVAKLVNNFIANFAE
ncbi:MAG: alpha/beta hydrolase, partial [Alphaproteobacteria bacterium]|nr:alpha/beta hydrolase [Alphaproteobacteria bacterium]